MSGGRGSAGAAVVAVARQRLRRRRLATALLLVLTGVSAAVPLALWSASRRTATALDDFVERSDVPTAQVLICPPGHDPATEGQDACFEEQRPEDLEAVRSVPGVMAAAQFNFHPVVITGVGGEAVPAGLGISSLEEGAPTATVAGDPIVLAGRLASATAPDEIMITEPATRTTGLAVGDRVDFRSALGPPDAEQPPVESEIVGVVRTPADLLPLPLESIGGPGFHARAGWVEAHGEEIMGFGATVLWFRGGDADAFVERAQDRFPGQVVAADPVLPQGETDTIEHATSLESRAGLALAVTGALAAAFFVGQAVSRQSRAEAADDASLAGLGMTRRQLAAVPACRWLPVAAGGALLAAVVAWAASALGPIGVARRGLWDRAPTADWPVLGVGAVVTLAIVLTIPVVVGLRRRASGGPGGTAVQAAAVGPPGLRTGIGFAWASVRRGAALPLVSAVAATAIALAAIITAAGGVSSLRLVVDEPERFGAPWDALVPGGGDFESPEQAGDTLAALPGIASVAGIAGEDVAIGDDDQVWVQALHPVGQVPVTQPVVISGRAPATDGEIALGTVTMDDTGTDVGDEVALEATGQDEPLRYRVVGVAMITDGFEPNVGDGALVTTEGLARIDPSAAEEQELGIELADGPGREQALGELRRTVARTFVPFPVPATLANAERIAGLPLLLAAGGAVLAAITFVHALITSVRRNGRELAVCRVLGFTRRQVHGAVATQATLLAVAAVVVGLPVGIIGARWGWRVISRAFGVASGPVVPAWVVLVGAVAVLALANLAAAPPSRWTTRRRPADALRSE